MIKRKYTQPMLYTIILISGVLLALLGSIESAAAGNAAVPAALSSASGPKPAEFIYTVQEGDTLGQIARSLDTTVAAILAANPEISDPNRIYAGQRIVIPVDKAAPRVDLSPINGPPGTVVRVSGWDFQPGSPLTFSVGRAGETHQIEAKGEADRHGRVYTTITIPEDARQDARWTVLAHPFSEDSAPAGGVKSQTFTVTDFQGTAGFETLSIYLVARADRGISGEPVGCGDSLVPIEIDVNETESPIETALKRLLAIDEPVHPSSGLYTALDEAELTVADVRVERGLATIELDGKFAMGGVCDEPRMIAQLEETAQQFYRVDEADFLINGELLVDPRDILRYQVREGDTLGHIAVSFGVTTGLILNNNAQIENPNRIYAGQTLNIPRHKDILARVILAPTHGPAGAGVEVLGRGLPGNTAFEIGLGRADSEFGVIANARTNGSGELAAIVEIPGYAGTGERWVAVLLPASSTEKYVSNVYIIE